MGKVYKFDGNMAQAQPDKKKDKKKFNFTFVKDIKLSVLLCYILAGLCAYLLADKFLTRKTESSLPTGTYVYLTTAAPASTTAEMTASAQRADSAEESLSDITTAAQTTAAATAATTAVPVTTAAAQPAVSGLININTADEAALDTLPGIGPATAKAIIAYRTENGPFSQISDIKNVKGIGDKKFAEIQSLITV